MLRRRFSETVIATILKEAEAGTPMPELCRRYGMGHTTYYKWRNLYSGMTPDMLSQLKTLEAENARLKRMYADLSLEHQALKGIVRKKL